MTNQEFIKMLYLSITKENDIVYKDLFNNTDINKTTDPYWKEALKLYEELSKENRAVFFKVIKQVEIDAVSNVLGVFDGAVSLENGTVEVKVTFKDTDEVLNGDLQDLFLEYDEENR